ncbi:HWE histidine kinase domain-containing protein [Brevundimonas aurifodinae]|uniref:histidine kinase n=2 Tax=Brevundimonas TaxID=41275 RepID=A0ABV1NR19_9CAUL|nr:MAG: hypothetical protein B7Z42_01595 [Brevundimonas sp. 12-68-7]OYX30685.1 MAG: hypothetical protein B7Z01_13985 [Brevundimonas subvibrioides]
MTDSTAATVVDITDCLKTIGLDGTLRNIDPDGLCLLEIDDFGSVVGQPWKLLWPSVSQSLVEGSIRQAASGKVARFTAECPTAKGVTKTWDVCVTPIRDTLGDVYALQAISQDISRREHDRRETALVSKELSHRIKNLFAVVDSLIHLSARSQPEVRPFVQTLRQRLDGLGRAISFICPMDDADLETAPKTVKGLITALLVPYRDAGANVTLTGDDTVIGKDVITSLSLVLNELATNAVKYGAIKDASGELVIHLNQSADRLIIDWTETGLALTPSGDPTPGFGTMLLNRTVRAQLSGTIEREWLAEGLHVSLSIPLDRLV